MVIRQLVDALDKEVKHHEDAIRRLRLLQDQVVSCCRAEKANRGAGAKKGRRAEICPEEMRKAA